MRLTLRTLLAYRDRVLKPAELEDMHARVQQSAMAGNLLKRIEALSHRPTLLAPPIEGKGLGADANSIAEYLDDALKGEKVPELERICLESDVQLAELAQCHQLLGSALSTTVDVPAALRQRILALGDPAARAKALAERPTGLLPEPAPSAQPTAAAMPADGKARFRTDAPHVQATAGAASGQRPVVEARRVPGAATPQPVQAPMLASGGESIRPTGLDLEGAHLAHEVPEYLRGSSRDGWRGPLTIGALVALLALLVWQSIGSWDRVSQMFANRPSNRADSASADASSVRSNSGQSAGAVAGGGVAGSSAESADAADATPPDNRRGNIDAASDIAAAARSGSPQPGTGLPAVDAGDAIASASSAQSAARQPLSPAPVEPAGPTAAQWLPADAQSMQGIILVQTAASQPLHRLQPAERLPNRTQVFVPPATRPKLDLEQGPLWSFCGPTQMTLALPDTGPQGLPQVDLRLGKAVVSASTRAAGRQGQNGQDGNGQSPNGQGQSLVINTPDSKVLLTLADATSRVAVELSYVPLQHGPMTDRGANPPVLVVSVVDGNARVVVVHSTGSGDAPVELSAGQSVSISRGTATAPQTSAALPAWIDAASDRPVDVLAVEDLQRQLTGNEPVGATLQKLVSNRRPETRALAAETLALLGSWDWLMNEKNTLSDARDRSYWTPVLDLTRQVIAANPDDATNLRAALVKKDAARGAFQADMWIGLNATQLAGEGVSKLVDILDSEVLLDRVLAIYQLQRLTGKDLGYQAGEVNRASVQQWNRELASGRLQVLPPGQASTK